MSGENEISRADQLQHESHRRHSGARHHRAFSILELGQRIREILTRGVSRSRVVVEPLLSKTFERERRGEMNRRNHGAMMEIGRYPRSYRAG
jgi:hypothetical protein